MKLVANRTRNWGSVPHAGASIVTYPDGRSTVRDRKSTRLNSSHSQISYAVFCLKNKFRTVGEDYSTLDSIRRTGGLRPDSTWVENRENVQANAAIAHPLGVKVLTFHPGLLPHY